MAQTSFPNRKARTRAKKRQKRAKKRHEKREQVRKTTALYAQVLCTTELLEMILLRLPLKDLLLSQRVSPKWQAVIRGSQDLQKALFIRPATTELAYFHQSCCNYPGAGFERLINNPNSSFFYLCPPDKPLLSVLDRFEQVRLRHPRNRTHPPSNHLAQVAQVKQDKATLRSVVSRTQVFLNPLLLEKFPGSGGHSAQVTQRNTCR